MTEMIPDPAPDDTETDTVTPDPTFVPEEVLADDDAQPDA